MTLAAWRVFQTEFRISVQRLEQPTKEELHDLAMEAIHESIRRACIRDQERKSQEHPILKISGFKGLTWVQDLSEDEVEEMVQLTIGQNERFNVKQKNLDFIMNLSSQSASEELMMKEIFRERRYMHHKLWHNANDSAIRNVLNGLNMN